MITFIPGDANPRSASAGSWKNHAIVVYGSGNNLIITTVTSRNREHNLQTVYLPGDCCGTAINNYGHIAVATSSVLSIFTPANEYMDIPQWEHALDLPVSATSLAWSEENELAVGTAQSVELYRVKMDFGARNATKCWSMPSPTFSVHISPYGGRLVSVSHPLDSLVRVWTRTNYGETSLFDLTYLKHPVGEYIVNVFIGTAQREQAAFATPLGGGDTDSEVVYTYTSSNTLRVWGTYEYNGHAHVKCWEKMKVEGQDVVGIAMLKNKTQDEGNATVDPDPIKQVLFRNGALLPSTHPPSAQDTLLVFFRDSSIRSYAVTITHSPTAVHFELKDETKAPRHAFPSHLPEPVSDLQSLRDSQYPVTVLTAHYFDNISLVIHDSSKRTVRWCVLRASLVPQIQLKLMNKFQGHTKSIRKMVKSTDDAVLLSISGFRYNYLWRPFYINGRNILLNKIAIVDTKNRGNILKAIVIRNPTSSYLVVAITSGGYIGVLSSAEYHARELYWERVEGKPSLLYCVEGNETVVTAVLGGVTRRWLLANGKLERKDNSREQNSPKDSLVNVFHDKLARIDSRGLVTVSSPSTSSSFHTHISSPQFLRYTFDKIAVVDNSKRLTLWNVSSGTLEYEETFDEPIRHLRWAFLADHNTVLAVGFARQVYLYVQLRYDYTNTVPSFARIKIIDLSLHTSHEIGDMVWLNRFLIIGCGNQFFIDDKWVVIGHQSAVNHTIRELMSGYDENSDTFDIGYLARVLNGPLPLYHPQFLIQAMFIGEVALVHRILTELFRCLRLGEPIVWDLNIDSGAVIYTDRGGAKQTSSPSSLSIFTTFDSNLADLLLEKLTKVPLPLLTRHQQSTLLSAVSIAKDLLKHGPLLDPNGVRFLIAFRLAVSSKKALSSRDVSWAVHSDNKDLLVNIVDETFGIHNFRWDHIHRFRMMYWVHPQKLRQLVERANRNEYADSRDPRGVVSLLYVALRKKSVLVELWKLSTVAEKDKIAAFLKNDFGERRWQVAASKNAFVLLGKHRWIDASYFFLLAGMVKDCCMVLCNKLNDVHLAIAVAKLYDSPLDSLLDSFVVPRAVENHDRWLASWVLWQKNAKEESVQALIKTPEEMFPQHSNEVRSFLRDDPLLLVLFRDLRSKKIAYWVGANHIAPAVEFDFVVRVCSIYARMGCEYLGVLLVRNWSFERGVREVKEEVREEVRWVAPPREAFEEPDMSVFGY